MSLKIDWGFQMSNKLFCQGPHCHTYPTSDRFLKSKGIIRGRYAYSENNENSATRWGYQFPNSDKFFCSQGCKNEWLNENMTLVEMRIPVPFITERRISHGYRKVTTSHEGWQGNTYKTTRIEKIGVDNEDQSDVG